MTSNHSCFAGHGLDEAPPNTLTVLADPSLLTSLRVERLTSGDARLRSNRNKPNVTASRCHTTHLFELALRNYESFSEPIQTNLPKAPIAAESWLP